MKKSAWAAFRLAFSFFAVFFFLAFVPCRAHPDSVQEKEAVTSQTGSQNSREKEEREEEGEKTSKRIFDIGLRDELRISAERMSKRSEDEFFFEGEVDMISGASRIQADKIFLDNKTQKIQAEGSVLLDWKNNRLAGETLEFDIETENGTMTSALGYIEPDYIFTADRVDKIAEDKIVIYKAILTSCTQPTPYWSFRISRALIHLNNYAYLRNVLFRVKKAPVVYLPYLIWPVKEDRSAGLLFPEIGSTKDRGKVISEAFFWPIRRNMDLTIYADYYSLAGTAGGVEYNFLPNEKGRGRFLGYYLDDKITDSERYRFTYSQEQNFRNGFRLNAEINKISDFDYYTDFERDLKLSSRPYSLSRVDLSRNWSYYSLNIREEWREQRLGLGELIQSQLPEFELRGRSQKLGNSPLYLTFETSFINFAKETTNIDPFGVETTTYDADYLRYDLAPTLSLPFSPLPWLDLDFSMMLRETFYTKSLDPANSSIVLDDSLNRFLAGGRIEIIGPKFYRIFERLESDYSPRYKHAIEPRITYFYMPTFDQQNEVPRFDEIDFVGGGNQARFVFRNALYAKRPSSPSAPSQEEEEENLINEGETFPERDEDKRGFSQPASRTPSSTGKEDTQKGQEAQEGSPEGEQDLKKTEKTLNPVEIATLEIAQSYSFDNPLSFGRGETKKSSPIEATLRFNPSQKMSFDLRTRYDVIYKTIASTSISASLKKEEVGYLNLSMVGVKGLGGASDREQVSFEGGTRLFQQKLGFNVKASYDISNSFLPEQRYRVEYYTQCCGFYFEYLNRDFSFNERKEFRFAIDLKGIGKVIDFHHGFIE
jgi:lipopolysaccharide assembly outer membrane protein LptD (OstA)